jgi:hypothetical protein
MGKVLIIAIVILVILFVVGTGCGITQKSDKDSQSTDFEGFVSALQFNKPQALSEGDFLKSSINPVNCFQAREFTVLKGGACVVRIKDVDTQIRQLRVRLLQGTKLELISTPNNTKQNLPGKLEISPAFNPNAKDARNLDFYQEGGTLTLKCVESSQNSCRAKLEN